MEKPDDWFSDVGFLCVPYMILKSPKHLTCIDVSLFCPHGPGATLDSEAATAWLSSDLIKLYNKYMLPLYFYGIPKSTPVTAPEEDISQQK